MNTTDEVYKRLAKVLDTLPNGFPSTQSGVEIRFLKKIFSPEEADLFCDLRLGFETAEQIAKRTGRSIEGLLGKLMTMGQKGQIWALQFGRDWYFKMMPWVFGIFEFQLGRIDKEMAELSEEYMPMFGKQFFANKPQLMYILPIEETISPAQEALPYDRVSALIEKSQAFLVNECVCKKEHGLLDHPCDRPTEVCLAMAPVPGVFDKSPVGRAISKEEAYALLKKTEEAGLVHMTNNFQNGQFFICNCCKCCCGPLRAINDLGIPAWDVVNSSYYAVIDADKCISCGICAETRCQVRAIDEGVDAYSITPEKCIGCGLCISTCPVAAISLVRKDRIVEPPVTEDAWFDERGKQRGVDFSAYK